VPKNQEDAIQHVVKQVFIRSTPFITHRRRIEETNPIG
jgi:hypothetical protein